MLIYESDGFLEVDAPDILKLCRSKKSVSFGEGDSETFDLQATLCEYQDNKVRRCRVAFYAKVLKRALVFTVSDAETKPSWQHGEDLLAELGFELESVNLKLSPAMLEVVLRDVAGLSAPDVARAARTEQMQENAGLQKIVDDDPDSPQGKKAALKLSAAKRSEEKLQLLRQLLEQTFSPQHQANDETEALLDQVKDLTSRLEVAEKNAEEERTQREFSESITAAAEKRIQELEEILVDVETKSSGELKLKRKIAALQGQIKELKEELQKAQDDLTVERDNQGLFVEDVKSAQATIASLEAGLKEKNSALENAQIDLEEGLAEREELEAELKEVKLRVEVLTQDLETQKQQAEEFGESAGEIKQLQEKLTDTELALKDAQRENRALETDKDDADKEGLETFRTRCNDLVKQCEELKGKLELEASVRRRLERGASADDKRINELEEALAACQSGDADTADSPELLELRARLEEEQGLREDLEKDLEDAHKIVDSLEQMIREREEGAGGWQTGKEELGEKEKKLKELTEQANQMKAQLEQEEIAQKRLAKELASAENKITELEDEARQLAEELDAIKSEKGRPISAEETPEPAPAEPRKLPHELRPEPQKGAFFRPDWDLEGLPCTSSDDVLQAWETVFNVQISIEGYPSQYCMAFLVVVREGKRKKVYILYRLKMNKHTLVCVPAKTPKDEKSLKKAISEALKFLKMSGFEMDEMAPEHIESALKSYYLG